MTRWWGVRHLRYFWLSRRLALWMALWADYFPAPNPSDLAYLDAVWRGEA